MNIALALITLLAGALLAGCNDKRETAVTGEAARELLIDRNWMNRWPSGKDDRLHVYRFVPSMGGGVYQDRTLFLGQFELFHFDVSGDTLRFDLPDNDEQMKSRFVIEEVDGPEPFDLRLSIHPSPRGPGVYYSRKSETGATLHELDALLPGAGRK
jgi:hypothetical protein